ncbi:MAG: tRNA(Ile)-lysidine synthase [Dehalococcoidia bacterium]|nr:tRNA(Ile)-lysidine synthase [Chloroflexota bacterium]
MKVSSKIAQQLPRRVERFIAEHGLLERVESRESRVKSQEGGEGDSRLQTQESRVKSQEGGEGDSRLQTPESRVKSQEGEEGDSRLQTQKSRVKSQEGGEGDSRLQTPDSRLLVVGVSGGTDSICLLHVLLQLRDKLGIDLHVAHLNHQLRGAEADADAEHVSNLARQLGIAATIQKRDVTESRVKSQESRVRGGRDGDSRLSTLDSRLLFDSRSSLEEAAREVRYAFFAEVARATGAGAVAVGHTADDQAETLLMHLIRGTGLLGLRGMEPLSRWRLLDGTQLTVIRPLLEVSRKETEAYCAACDLSTRRDSSNISPKYLRNRIRAELIPVLREYNPRIRESLSRAARTIAADIAHLDGEVAGLWDSVAVAGVRGQGSGEGGLPTDNCQLTTANRPPTTAQDRPDAVALDNRAFSVLSPALQRHLLRSVLERLLGDLRDIELVHIEGLLKVLVRPAGKRLSLPGGLVFHGSYTESLITRAEDAPCPLPSLAGEYKLAIPGETMLPGWRVKATILETLRSGVFGVWSRETLCSGVESPLPLPRDSGLWTLDPRLDKACLDFDLTGAELVVRSRRDGDRFQPLGMGESKKLQDFMVDARIPRFWRDRVPLVCAGGQIIWVVGWRIDHRVRVTDSTRRVLCLEFESFNY